MEARRTITALIKGVSYLAVLALLVLLGSTGTRLWWYSRLNTSDTASDLLNRLGMHGNVLTLHLISGALLMVGLIIYLVYSTLRGRGPLRAPSGHRLLVPRFVAQIVLLLAGSLAVLSGLSLYCGWYHTPTAYRLLINIHRITGPILLIMVLLVIPFLHLAVRNSPQDAGPRLNVVVAAVASLVAAAVVILSLASLRTITLESVSRRRPATIDGIASPSEWQNIPAVTVPCRAGANFGSSVSWVTIRSFYDKQFVYFLFQWKDQTRSLNRRIVKHKRGWEVLKSDVPSLVGEVGYYEDQLAVSVSRKPLGCFSSCHLAQGRGVGVHFTTGDTIDLWQWRAEATNPSGQADDGWWGGMDDSTGTGRHFDNSPTGAYYSNLNKDWNQPYFVLDYPTQSSWVDLKSNALNPYSAEDDTFSIGATLPGLLVTPFMGDRGNVRARGIWRNGIWSLEMARARVTGSPSDIPFRGTVYLNIALFDNAESAHAFEIRPIQLRLK